MTRWADHICEGSLPLFTVGFLYPWEYLSILGCSGLNLGLIGLRSRPVVRQCHMKGGMYVDLSSGVANEAIAHYVEATDTHNRLFLS